MGRDVPAMIVSQQDRHAYREKVRLCLDVFARMLRESKFDNEPSQVGVEIELNLVDDDCQPAMTSTKVLDAIADPNWASELGRFNLEINVPPRRLGGQSLGELETAVVDELAHAAERAKVTGSRLVMIGILPTVRQHDVTDAAMSANPRYRLLNDQMIAARGEDMRINIDGPERLLTHVDTIMPEACCTSVQFHLQVSPESFSNYWNAAQAVAGIQVALAANSPFLFGRELWRETRIPLFEQVTDTRPEELKLQGVRPRVWFGERWITSVFDLFEENLRYFPALLPLREDEDPEVALDSGEAPQLAELTLHNGTVYRWNRPVYAVVDGRPHLRVENRVLPAGPTVADVLANAAFYYGVVRALAETERPVWTRMSFTAAADNLVQGARHGIDARVYWPGMGETPVTELVLRRLLPLAMDGLQQWGVSASDSDRLLGIIEQRCLSGRTGASWQVESVHSLDRGDVDRRSALRRMTRGYIERMATNTPVHSWPAL
ncbi:MAG TPA: glutamate--cysteine ligase [Streptosporangiaceae bacterium]|jgi:gamma-glutamyl:cysteine ligase YbdK (ATP-grasp superfamily)|nr:glutamate--cysteine ligase [Streptosporangiaceae bacterium]